MLITTLIPARAAQRSKQQNGFTMIEALIALVVFSIGLLGLAAMYSKSMMVTHSAYMRSLASIQAMDMAERIRANIFLDHSSDGYELLESGSQVPVQFQPTLCQTDACSPTVLRDWDVNMWLQDTRNLFGALFDSAVISFDSAEDEYEIVLQWRERAPEAGAGGSGQELVDFTYRVTVYTQE